MDRRRWELIASDEPTILAKPLLDAIVMEDFQSDGCLANPASTDESNRNQVVCQIDDLLDQLVTPKEDPGRRGRRFTRYPRWKCKNVVSRYSRSPT